MTSVFPAGGLRTSMLVDEDGDSLRQLLVQDKPATVYLRSLIHEFGVSPSEELGHGRFYGAWREGELVGTAFVGNARNMVTLGPREAVRALLTRVAQGPLQPRLFVGPEDHAPDVRRFLAREGLQPRLDRRQTYYVMDTGELPDLEPLPMRRARHDELGPVVRAHAAMIEEDLEIPNAHLDMDRLRTMTEHRLTAGKVWVHMNGPEVLFKTEEVCRAEDGILVGGVYTHPRHRGRGLATRGMTSWARTLRDEDGLERLALHVNAVNTPAYRAYERAGFRRTGTLRLVLTY